MCQMYALVNGVALLKCVGFDLHSKLMHSDQMEDGCTLHPGINHPAELLKWM